MQKVWNYGSFLQALSLKTEFERRGHEVYFIDIIPGRRVAEAAPAEPRNGKKLDRYLINRIRNRFFRAKMTRIHVDTVQTYLKTEKTLPEPLRYGLAVIGSDEVFNAAGDKPWGFSPQLFGRIDRADRVATYAASCGDTTAEDAVRLGLDGEIRDGFRRIFAFSVRDENTRAFVKRFAEIEPRRHVDPVFLADYEPYLRNVSVRLPKKPYVLIYAYNNRICDPREIDAIKRFAAGRGLGILCVGMQQRWCRHNVTASAFELLAYVKAADCVITDTFHGTVFSIKYKRPFAAFIRESNRNKLGDLLALFGLEDRAVGSPERLETVMAAAIDFERVHGILETEKQRAARYLDEICLAASSDSSGPETL